MSQYGLIYRVQFDSDPVDRTDNGIAIASKRITVNIYDTELLIDDADTPEIINLQPAKDASPLSIEVIDNNEDKFSPIRAKQAIIQFLSDQTQGQDMTAFSDSADNRWRVTIDADSDIVFEGFLMLSDMQQPFLPDPQVITLTASDHLGVLHDVPLTNDSGVNPIGKYTIAELVATCLKKTDLSLELLIINNLRHGSGFISPVPETIFIIDSGDNQIRVADTYAAFFYPGQRIIVTGTTLNNSTFTAVSIVSVSGTTKISVAETVTAESALAATLTDQTSLTHFYSTIFIDAKTWETTINECEDCYTVLTKILKEDCCLFQYNGKWMIIRLDEYDGNPLYKARFDADGFFIEFLTPDSGTFDIGITEDICHADVSTLLRNDRPHKFVKETYKYVNPLEIICNIDFERGDYIEDGPDITKDGITYNTKHYTVECWEMKILFGQPIVSTAYIRRLFSNGTEKERYLVITPSTNNATPIEFLECQPIQVQVGDKANISISFASESDFGSGGGTIFVSRVWLYGDDGKWYHFWHPTSLDVADFFWHHPDGDTEQLEKLIGVSWDAGITNESQWRILDISLLPMPVSGKLYVGLNQHYQGVTAPALDFYFQSLNVELIPIINGSYIRYTGHYNQVTRNPAAGYNAVRDEEVFIGDSPRQTFKGAMFYLGNAVYQLTSRFYAGNVFALTGAPPLDALHPYGYIQAFSVWNQYRNANRIFPATLYGLFRSDDQWADLWQKYRLTDTNANTNNRYFILISFKQDWKTCRWTGTFIEVYRTDLGHVYGDTWTFKYITE